MRHFALSALVLAVAQPALSETFNVVVGGPGVLKFNPPFVVSTWDSFALYCIS